MQVVVQSVERINGDPLTTSEQHPHCLLREDLWVTFSGRARAHA